MAELNTSVLYYGDNLDMLWLTGTRPELPSTRSPFAQAPLERADTKQGQLLP